MAVELQGTVPVRQKPDGAGPVTGADLAVEQFVLEGLAETFPGEPVLSEESSPEIDRSVARYWCLDPIDGTREYADGRAEWAVQLALVEDGVPVLGVLGLPGRVFGGARGQGAFVQTDESRPGPPRRSAEREGGTAISLAALADPRRAVAVHSRSHRDQETQALLNRLGVADRFPAGGIGYKIACLLEGRAQLYLYPGGGCKLWDTAAPAAVWCAAGGTATDIEGAPLRYDGPLRHDDGLVFAAPGLLAPTLAAINTRPDSKT